MQRPFLLDRARNGWAPCPQDNSVRPSRESPSHEHPSLAFSIIHPFVRFVRSFVRSFIRSLVHASHPCSLAHSPHSPTVVLTPRSPAHKCSQGPDPRASLNENFQQKRPDIFTCRPIGRIGMPLAPGVAIICCCSQTALAATACLKGLGVTATRIGPRRCISGGGSGSGGLQRRNCLCRGTTWARLVLPLLLLLVSRCTP